MNEDNSSPVSPPEVELVSYHHQENIFKNTKFLSLLVLAVVLPVMTLVVMSGKLRLGSKASELPATPPTTGSWSNLSANTPLVGNAVFNFSYLGNSGNAFYIYLSTKADFSVDVYASFGDGYQSPITVPNPTKWDKYSAGRTLYWRVVTALGDKSPIQSTIVVGPVSPTPNPLLISCANIQAWYKMDQTPNNTVVDSVNNLNGILSGASVVPGYRNNGLAFNGTSGNSVLISSTYGVKRENLSIGAWVKIPNTSVKGAFVKIGNAVSGVVLGIGNGNFENPGNELVVLFEHTRWIPTGVKIPADGNWHYVTLVVNNVGIPFVYLDGVSGKADGYGGSLLIIPPLGNVSSIGGYTSSGNTNRYVNAVIDEVGIWNRALTANEVTQLARGASCTQMVTTPTSAPDTRIIGGRVVSSCKGTGVANVGISLFNNSWGNAWSYTTTDANGNFRIYNRARVNDGYQVAITGTPTGYSSIYTPSAPNNVQTHNWCALNANTPGGSVRYDCQKVGANDCAGANTAGVKYRCNFIAKCN